MEEQYSCEHCDTKYDDEMDALLCLCGMGGFCGGGDYGECDELHWQGER